MEGLYTVFPLSSVPHILVSIFSTPSPAKDVWERLCDFFMFSHVAPPIYIITGHAYNEGILPAVAGHQIIRTSSVSVTYSAWLE